ncbi:alpha/beta hydrolase family protein [Streptomyces sp. NPDC055722]
MLGGRTFRIHREFLDDIAGQPQAQRIARLGVPLLVMHPPADTLVGIDNVRVIFDAARHPKSFVVLDGADHLLTRPRDAQFAADVLSAWGARYAGRRPGASGD